jgi:hypothetical protein
VLITRSIVGLLHVDHAPACEDGDGVVESREQEAQTDTHTHTHTTTNNCPVLSLCTLLPRSVSAW